MKSILLTISFFLFACSSNSDDVSGITDIETGGQIAGTLYTANGTPENGVTVSLISDGYSPVVDSLNILRKTVLSNTEGHYAFDNLDSGLYALEVINENASTGFYNSSLLINDTSDLESSDTLQGTGTIVITLSDYTPIVNGQVYVKNSTRVGSVVYSVDSIATVVIDKLPTGVYPEFYFSGDAQGSEVLLNVESVDVVTSDTNYVTTIDTIDASSASISSSSSLLELSSSLSSSSLSSQSSQSSSSVEVMILSSMSVSSSSNLLVPSVLNFNGRPEHVKIESDMNYDWPTYGITFETWVRWDVMDTIIHLFHLSKGPNDDYAAAFGLREVNGMYNLRYAMTNTDPSGEHRPWIIEEVYNALFVGEWMHIALCVTPSGLISFYKNGELIRSKDRGIFANPDAVERSVNYLGQSTVERDGVFDGRMDNARIWNRALTASEIKRDMYHSTEQLSDTTRLVLSYDFVYNPLQMTIVKDGSVNGNDGTLIDMLGTYGDDATWVPQVDFEE
ncbi:MAG: LamG domain-containing protein [Fibrobacterales bacterium]